MDTNSIPPTGQLPKLNLICGNDELHPVMMHVYMDRTIMIATDAHKMVWAVPQLYFDEEFIEEIPEGGIRIHHEDWKRATDCKEIEWKDETTWRIKFQKKRPVLIEFEKHEDAEGVYPNYKAVIPERFDGQVEQIGVNSKLLEDMRKAMGFQQLKLMFVAENKAIGVRSSMDLDPNFDELGGILMPVLLEHKDPRQRPEDHEEEG